jgi:hypothetical protein
VGPSTLSLTTLNAGGDLAQAKRSKAIECRPLAATAYFQRCEAVSIVGIRRPPVVESDATRTTTADLRVIFFAPSVDPLTRDLPGPWIQHQPHRSGPVAQEGKAGMVAAIHEELVA